MSEDVLKDGRKQYENGQPTANGTEPTVATVWGKVPASQSLIYAFDTENANRNVQDIGLDGLSDADEAQVYNNFAGEADPAADNYDFYLSVEGDILTRYRNYNGLQGNSPVDVTNNFRGSSTLPDVEDLNRDNTMNTINAYFEYGIDIRPDMQVGENYLTDIREIPNVPIAGSNGQTIPARWLQFKVPVASPERVIGGISDFRSVRFMRMFMTGFSDQITLRFGTLDLVRGEWRRFTNTLDPQDSNVDDDDTNMDILTVNIQENANRLPINYTTPPGVVREQLFLNNTIINQNEQSLSLRVTKRSPALPGLGGLEPGDSRAVFKNLDVDMRQFNKLRMFIHAEALPLTQELDPLQDDEMVAFIRFGNDFTENFYQIEIPLKVTPQQLGLSAEQIWLQANELELNLALLTKLKILSLGSDAPPIDPETGIRFLNEIELDANAANKSTALLRLGIKGNPNFGLVRTLMVGLKNNTNNATLHPIAKPIRGEVWFNELRVSDMNNNGGMAAILNLDANMADFATVSLTGKMSTIGFGALEEGSNERSREDVNQYDVVTNLNLGMLMPKKWGVKLPFNYGIGEEIITPEYDPFYQDIRLEQLLSQTTNEAERDNMRERAIDYTKRKSINFIGVRKERGEEQKQRIYDVENLTISHSYNQVDRHNYEIEEFTDLQTRTTLDYTYNFNSKPIEPFKKTKFMSKSQYWKLLSDFNFNYLPSNINFSSNIIRQYNRQKFRQVEVQGIGLEPLFQRNYQFNYAYGFNYNFTKSLRLNYAVNTNNIVRNYIDEEGFPNEENRIWDDYWNSGIPNQHNQSLTVNYELPLNKLPFLSFVKSTYSYTGTYNWNRANLAFQEVVTENGTFNLGNNIQNSGAHRLNTILNMTMFYKYIGLTKTKKANKTNKPKVAPKPGEKITSTKTKDDEGGNVFLDGLIGVVTSVKNIQVNYVENSGTQLPGYLPGIGFFGSSRPSIPFVFGLQDDVRDLSAQNGWLTNYPDFNQNYTEMVNKTLNITAKVDLFPDFTIDLIADRNQLENYNEQFDVSDGVYNSRSPYTSGSFSISTNLIRTAFSTSDVNNSSAFAAFRENRIVVAERLATQYYGPNFPVVSDPTNPNFGYPVGFGKNSQAVLIPSFLAAYQGTEASGISLSAFRNFPIPNWTIKYSGLMRYQFFKDKFRRFSIQHSYRATYTMGNYRSNFEYERFPNALEPNSGNFYNKTIIQNVALTEQFNPLVRFDMELKSSFKILAELKRERALSLSFDNNLLTEMKGAEYIVGLGYRFKDVIFSSKLANNTSGTIKSDLNVRADMSMRRNETMVRYLDYDNNQLTGGQEIWALKFTADYAFSKEFTGIFFYDHTFNQAVISTAFPMTNIRTGFTLRYNFGN
ncbi:MAG: cell surface protein SprA [Flavobacterium sp.]